MLSFFQVEDKFGLKFSAFGDDSEDTETVEVRICKHCSAFQ